MTEQNEKTEEERLLELQDILETIEDEEGTLPTKAYEPTADEVDVMAALKAAREGQARMAKIKLEVVSDSGVEMRFDHECQTTAARLNMHHVGAKELAFFFGLIQQICSLTEPGKAFSEDAANFVLSAVRQIEPRDEAESMLATQMAATYQLTMISARRLAIAQNANQKSRCSPRSRKTLRGERQQNNLLHWWWQARREQGLRPGHGGYGWYAGPRFAALRIIFGVHVNRLPA